MTEAEKNFIRLVRKVPKTKKEISEMDVWLEKFEQELRDELAPLNNELKRLGVGNDVWDLVNTTETYKEAVPYLIAHLDGDYHKKNIDGIVRSLAVKEATGLANDVLFALYDKTPNTEFNLKWVIANSIGVVAITADYDRLIAAVKKKSNGRSRERFVRVLGNFKNKESEDLLIKCLEEDELRIAAIFSLGKRKSKKALPKIKYYSNSGNSDEKKEARKAIKKIEK